MALNYKLTTPSPKNGLELFPMDKISPGFNITGI